MSDPVLTADDHKAATRAFWRSSCHGKEQFESRAVAENVARRMQKNGRRVDAYKCRGCGKYHIGSKP